MKYDPEKGNLKEDIIDRGGAELLDDTIEEQAAFMARAINEDGVKAQIEFLITQRGWTEEQIWAAATGEPEED